MTWTYDPEADSAQLTLSSAAVEESEEVGEGIVLDFDATGKIVRIEVLHASLRLLGSVLDSAA